MSRRQKSRRRTARAVCSNELFARCTERLEPRLLLATFTVTTAADLAPPVGTVSLRQAIIAANAATGPDIINFNIPGGGVQTIAPFGATLPDITDPVFINGYSQPGASVNTNPFGQTDNA